MITTPGAQINVIDVIPQSQSGEATKNAEPSIAVNPNNTNVIEISSFGTTPGAAAGTSPYFFTSNGGKTWSNPAFDNYTFQDTNSRFSLASGVGFGTLYGGFLFNNTKDLDVRQDTGIGFGASLGNSHLMQPAVDPDQPSISVGRGVNPANGMVQDRIYEGYNDLARANGQTASLQFSVNNGTTWTQVGLDKVSHVDPGTGMIPAGANLDSAAIRSTVNSNTVYAAFERYTGFNDGVGTNADKNAQIIVMKDTNGGLNGFNALGGGNGTNVLGGATTIRVPDSPNGTNLGNLERLGSDLSITVDPNNANHVLVSYAASIGGVAHLHVAASTDGGVTFKDNTAAVLKGENASLPALAIASNGGEGLLYTEFTGGRLVTHLIQSLDDFATVKSDSILFSFTDNDPKLTAVAGQPFIGDFQDLVSFNNTFFGAFSASNNFNDARSNQNVLLQRNFDMKGPAGSPFELLDNNTPAGVVNFTIDPYFFTSAAVPEPATFVMLATGLSLAGVWRWSRVRRRESRADA